MNIGKFAHYRSYRWATAAFVMSLVLWTDSSSIAKEKEQFDQFEIRVIRRKFFSKTSRFELGGELRAVMNETFTRTYMLTGLMTYHLSETWAFEAAGSYGFSLDREEKRILFDEYDIKTQVFRTLYAFEGALLYTPIYGKWQLPSGRLIYFDTFLAGGAGMTGLNWKYNDFCISNAQGTDGSIPADKVAMYPNWLGGLGQRFFLSNSMAIRWDFRFHGILYDTADEACPSDNAESGTGHHMNVTLSFGASTFF